MPHTRKKGSDGRDEKVAESDNPIFFYGLGRKYEEFSQWYSSSFSLSRAQIAVVVGRPVEAFAPLGEHDADEQLDFNTAEQFMMYCKAARFHDGETASQIIQSKSPRDQKALGRLVSGFDDASWDAVKDEVVEQGNRAKFGQSEKLKAVLLNTGERELIEAAANDRVWGIGFNEKTARMMTSRQTWGENRLGKALVRAREQLRKEDGAMTGAGYSEEGEPTDTHS